MDRALPEEQAEGGVVRRRRHAPDGVARIDVLERDVGAALLEVFRDRVPQEDADVAVFDVPRCVPLPVFAISS